MVRMMTVMRIGRLRPYLRRYCRAHRARDEWACSTYVPVRYEIHYRNSDGSSKREADLLHGSHPSSGAGQLPLKSDESCIASFLKASLTSRVVVKLTAASSSKCSDVDSLLKSKRLKTFGPPGTPKAYLL